jgi:hypothetical protein
MMNSNIQIISPKSDTMCWQVWLKEGDQYLNAATPKGPESKFGKDVLYNLLAMAFEKYAMAIADYFDVLPYNHTFTDLINTIDPLVKLPPELKSRILSYEDIQSICAIDDYQRNIPARAELADFRQNLVMIQDIARTTCVS